ncbi:hypothetical protein C0J08_03505 [Marinomonas sp. CT5]|nr:hypothetical protein C0J08_03505 [Marinomonas sp. CT5]
MFSRARFGRLLPYHLFRCDLCKKPVSSEAYYITLAVLPDMTQEVIGIYNAPTESAGCWDEICQDLKRRGLKQADLFVTDNLTELDSTIERHFDAAIQKCVLHLKRSILRKTKKQHRSELAADLATIFQLDPPEDSKNALYDRARQPYHKWEKIYPNLKPLVIRTSYVITPPI